MDHLLEDGRLEIAAISGTFAGAMNAVALADGFTAGGADGAREKLQQFWFAISKAAKKSPIKRAPIDVMMGYWSLERSPGYLMMDMMSRMFSPYQLNPIDMNPLRDLVEACIDFDCVRHCMGIRLFISATNVETGRVKVFDSHTLTADMVMASACLPHMFKAVMIDNVPYWDGGFMGNPSLFPFHTESDTADTVIIQINPVERKGVPRSSHDIQNRLNEITFNSSLLKELRSIDFVARPIEDGKLGQQRIAIARHQGAQPARGATLQQAQPVLTVQGAASVPFVTQSSAPTTGPAGIATSNSNVKPKRIPIPPTTIFR